jgi:hypothetical protein
MARYLLLLHENPAVFSDLSPADFEAIVREYTAWSADLRAKGRLAQGEKLKDEGGRRVRRDGERLLVSDGPFAEAKDVIGGLFVVQAASYEEAVALAQGCPHLRFGEIEVREIDET